MRFFSQFPKTNLKIADDRFDTSLIDIYRHVDINETLVDDLSSYTYYTIKDGERPDVVSFKLYKTPEFHWSFFIVNENMKNGLDDWPRSYREQESYIKRKYGEYSVLEFIPKQNPLSDYNSNIWPELNGKGKHEILDTFGSIDLSDPKLYLKDENGLNAKTVSFDGERLQLWVNNLSGLEFLSNEDKDYTLEYKAESDSEYDDWLSNQILPFLKIYREKEYYYLINDPRIEDDYVSLGYTRGIIEEANLDEFTSDDFEVSSISVEEDPIFTPYETGTVGLAEGVTILTILKDELLETIKFTSTRSWLESYNAPSNYYDANDEHISALDARKNDNEEEIVNDNFITYYAAEEEENEAKTQIRVLRSSEIEAFADYYKELINE